MSFYSNVSFKSDGATLVAQPHLQPVQSPKVAGVAAVFAATADADKLGNWTAIDPSYAKKMLRDKIRQNQENHVKQGHRTISGTAKALDIGANTKVAKEAHSKVAAPPSLTSVATGEGVKKESALGAVAATAVLTATAATTKLTGIDTTNTQLSATCLTISTKLIKTKPEMLNEAQEIRAIHFSQSSIAEYTTDKIHYKDLVEKILNGKFTRSGAISLVIMPTAVITSYDNRRMYCAHIAAKSKRFDRSISKIYVLWHMYSDTFDRHKLFSLKHEFEQLIKRCEESIAKKWKQFSSNITSGTYGEAICLRMRSGWDSLIENIEYWPEGYPYSSVIIRSK